MPRPLYLPFLCLILLAACVEEGRYPISAEECDPSDPVHDLDAADCLPVAR